MLDIPNDIMAQFKAVLMKKVSPLSRHADYKKWLRYYLDFRSKYSLPDSKSEHVRLFIEKLRAKNQTPEQQKEAAHALSLYFEIERKTNNETPSAQINTEKTVKATTPFTPFIKGEFPRPYNGNYFSSSGSHQPFLFLRCKLRALNKSFSSFSGLTGESKFSLKSKKSGFPPSRE